MKRAASCGGAPNCVVTVYITPAYKAPLHVGDSAGFKVTPTAIDVCSVFTAKVAVVGANPGIRSTQTWSNDGYYPGYQGNKAGIDNVTVSASISACNGFGPYTIQYASQQNYSLWWGRRDNAGCVHKDSLKGKQADRVSKRRCADDPVDGGLGVPELGATDATLPSPGVPFDFSRYYTAGDTTQGSLGYGWRSIYDARLVINTGVSPHTITATLGTSQQLLFTQQTDGSWLAPSWTTATLSYVSGTYVLQQADRLKWVFNSSNGYLTGLQRNGQTLTVYTQYGIPDGVTTSNGKTLWFTLDSNTRITQVALPDGRHSSYTYDAAGNLATVTDLRGGVTSYTYDSTHRLLTEVDPNGHTVVTNTYGADGRIATQTDALGNATTYTWSTDATTGNTTLVVADPRGNNWTQKFTADGQLASETDPLSNTASYTYDGNGVDLSPGNPLTYTDPAGNTTTYQYDSRSNLLQTTLPGSITPSATYNGSNDMLTATNGRGYTTNYSYDANGNTTLITQPDTKTVQLAYNSAGQLISRTDQSGKTTTYGYDTAGNLTSETTPLGNETTYGYDSSGRLTSTVGPRGNVAGANPNDYKTTRVYNNADQVTSVTDPLGHVTAYTYDADGNLTSRTDPNGHTWQYTYDADSRLTKLTAPDASYTSYAYDGAGNLTSRTDANGHTTIYTYDADNRLIVIVDPLNRTWNLHYDADSNLTSETTPTGGTITYTYDALGQRTGISYSDGTPSVGYAYDANGNRTSLTDGAGTASYTYNELDQLTQVVRGTATYSYTYDAVGRTASRTYPDSTSTTYVYDNDGDLTSATTAGNATAYQYDPAADLVQTTLPNAITATETYDRAGRVTQIMDGFRTFAYGYDAAGNTTSRTVSGVSTSYTYDALDRLTDVTGATSLHYGYDAVGNRTSMTDSTGSTSYSYDNADELQAAIGPAGTTNYGYNANGNETSAGPWTYGVNLANEMTSAGNGTASVTYTYDGDGNRVSATNGGSTTAYGWDSNFALPQLAAEQASGGSLLRRYSYGVGRISMTTPNTTAYYSSDALGSVTEMSGTGGSPLGQYNANPYGDGQTNSGVDPSVAGNPFGLAGELRDATTGLYDLRARQYDPTTSRFTSPDPLGPQEAASMYAYVGDNPLRYVDPSGMKRTPPCSYRCMLITPPGDNGMPPTKCDDQHLYDRWTNTLTGRKYQCRQDIQDGKYKWMEEGEITQDGPHPRPKYDHLSDADQAVANLKANKNTYVIPWP